MQIVESESSGALLAILSPSDYTLIDESPRHYSTRTD